LQPCITVLVPLAILLLGTLAFHFTDADLKVSRLFYGGAPRTWIGMDSEPWTTLYKFGAYPGLALGVASLIAAAAGCCWVRLESWRRAGLFLGLLLAVGPGLAINGVFKEYWGRARPRQLVPFGGSHAFTPVWSRGPCLHNSSFPSGHASMGFYLMGPAFLLYRRRPGWAIGFVLLGVAGGVAIGLARVAQGAHFPSDVLWSAGAVYITGLLLYRPLGLGAAALDETGAVPREDPRGERGLILRPGGVRAPAMTPGRTAMEPEAGGRRKAA
jgi:membrane-associated PAP2 superfamily phosphatase